MKRIYLDHNATTPLRPEVAAVMRRYLEEVFGNPSSLHAFGQEAREGVEQARAVLAGALGCAPEEVCFTSGGTEADNWALRGAIQAGGRVVTTAIEHHAVWHTCQDLERHGCRVAYARVDSHGVVDPDEVGRLLGERTALVSVMHANNETGSIQPVEQIGGLARARGALFHVDAVQTFGKLPVRVDELNADLVSISAHKINGPKGVGALYIRQGTRIAPWAHGGGHEGNRRAGTENVAGIAAFGKAAELSLAEREAHQRQIGRLRDRLQEGLLATIGAAKVNGHPQQRLANTLNLSFRGVEAEAVVLGLDLEGVAVSSGSACSSGSAEPSHVLLAMGLEPRLAASAVRFSLGWGNTEEEVDRVVEVLPGIVRRLRELSVFS